MLGYWCLLLVSCAGSDVFPDIGNKLSNPSHIAIDSASKRAYLVNSNNKVYYNSGSLQAFDISSPTAPSLLGTIELPNFSGGIYLDAANKYVFITNRLSSDDQDEADQLYRINIDEGSNLLVIDTYAAGDNPVGLASDGTDLYVVTLGASLDRYALPTPSTSTSLNLTTSLSDGTSLTDVGATRVAIIGAQAFISRSQGGVLVINLAEIGDSSKNPVDYFISDFTSPRGVATDGVNLYVADVEEEGASLYVINPASLTALSDNSSATLIDKDDQGLVAATIEIGTDPQEVAVGAQYVFVTNMGADLVTVVDKAALTKVQDITVGDEPYGLGVLTDNGVDTYLYVTNIQSNSVSIIDLAAMTTAATYQ